MKGFTLPLLFVLSGVLCRDIWEDLAEGNGGNSNACSSQDCSPVNSGPNLQSQRIAAAADRIVDNIMRQCNGNMAVGLAILERRFNVRYTGNPDLHRRLYTIAAVVNRRIPSGNTYHRQLINEVVNRLARRLVSESTPQVASMGTNNAVASTNLGSGQRPPSNNWSSGSGGLGGSQPNELSQGNIHSISSNLASGQRPPISNNWPTGNAGQVGLQSNDQTQVSTPRPSGNTGSGQRPAGVNWPPESSGQGGGPWSSQSNDQNQDNRPWISGSSSNGQRPEMNNWPPGNPGQSGNVWPPSATWQQNGLTQDPSQSNDHGEVWFRQLSDGHSIF